MEERDLHKLKRSELLEILLAQSEEIDRLRAEIETKDKQLADRSIAIQNAGSIAEASLQLTRVFVEAQTAADIYVANVKAQADKRAAEAAGGYATASASEHSDNATTREAGVTASSVTDPNMFSAEAINRAVAKAVAEGSASVAEGTAPVETANSAALAASVEASETSSLAETNIAPTSEEADALTGSASNEATDAVAQVEAEEAVKATDSSAPAEDAEAVDPDPAAPAAATQPVPGAERYARSHYGSAGRANHAASAEAASALDNVNVADDLDDDDDEPPRGRHAFIPGKAVGAR